ncbi:RNA polymerase sigma factor [Aliikangiella coralliicola]|uniref:RNA polymerase sigma factor n=1 Tax=Aliikangiella coralliicola TaxID=2592383 RepID=A0A545UJE4_9GAMM|nr:RNA polymerase sigma factor [Aliikangiella coralliicola]TQV89580.1 RNA polymerase sigma factor [Aliikangiella coralliicola]
MSDKNKKQGLMSLGSRIYNVFLENEVIIKRFLRRYSSNSHDIEDISQETILRALDAEKNREIQQPKAFLFGVAKNIARKSLEKKSQSLIDFIEDFGDKEYLSNEPSIDESIDSRKRMLIFWEAVSVLPSQCQKVFVLKKVHGYSHKEIAKNLEISISTVEKHVATGLKRCSEYMEMHQSGAVKHDNIVDIPNYDNHKVVKK